MGVILIYVSYMHPECESLFILIFHVNLVLLISNQVDAGNVYGDNLERQLSLRLLKDGKMKYQVCRTMHNFTPAVRKHGQVSTGMLL